MDAFYAETAVVCHGKLAASPRCTLPFSRSFWRSSSLLSTSLKEIVTL